MKKITKFLLILVLGLSTQIVSAETIESVEIHNKEKIKLKVDVFKVSSEKASTIVVLHGCGGVDSHHKDWARQLTAWGFNSVILDSFSTRNERLVCQKPFSVTPSQRAVDLHYTSKWISEQSWGKGKIGVIGFSHGGWSTLYAVSKKEIVREVKTSNITSAVSFYPYCDNSRIFDSPGIPIQIHIGNLDMWTPATLCSDLARNWNISDNLFIYSNSYHGFDRRNTNISVHGHVLKSNPEADQIARERVRDFFNLTLNSK